MKSKLLTATLLLLVTQISHADVIRCYFTEPFYTTTYSMVQQSLHINGIDGSKVIRNVSFQILGPGRFELWSRNNRVIQRLWLNNSGSDGMSDFIYPYEVQWTDIINPGMGGCESNFLKKKLTGP